MRRAYCSSDCDYQKYYEKQAGSGLSDIRVFRGLPYQRGLGIGSVVKRFGIPLIQFLGRHLLSTGMSIGSDLMANKDPKTAIKTRLKEGSKAVVKEGLAKLTNMVDQVGTGKKLYKSIKKNRTKVKKLKKDIFS